MRNFYRRRRVCQMCAGRDIDYKDVNVITRYINDKGKISPRRSSGACAKHQRHIAREVKRARFMALIPYVK